MPKKNQSPDPFKPYKGRFKSYYTLPKKGRDKNDILKELTVIAREEDVKWKTGRVSGTFYHAGEEHRKFLNKIFALFSHVNILQADICPSMSKFESEIVSMTAKMLNGDAVKKHNPDDEVCGTLSSGGTDSIMMGMKTYRDWAMQEKGIKNPEIIIPRTAHPAFNKAGEYFGIKIKVAPVDKSDFRVDLKSVEAQITKNTAAIVGSAGNYPYGLIDPLDKLSDLALKYNIGFHVDGCLGGFILPWVEKLGYKIPVFDFRLKGVTSISADTHKYGFGLKGTSVILYRNKKLRKYQFFQVPDWPGGLYASPTMAGSRSGGLSASTWAAMIYMGEEGYMRSMKAIMKIADKIKEGIKKIPELSIIGDPTFVISFLSDKIDIFHVNDYMSAFGWRFNCLHLPPALHFCVTMPQTAVPDLAGQFLRDLRKGVDYAKENKGNDSKSSALYGLAGTIQGNEMVSEIMLGYFDMFYEV